MEFIPVPAGLEDFGAWVQACYERILLNIDRARMFLADDVDNLFLDTLCLWQNKVRNDEVPEDYPSVNSRNRRTNRSGNQAAAAAAAAAADSPDAAPGTKKRSKNKKKKVSDFVGMRALGSSMNVFTLPAPKVTEKIDFIEIRYYAFQVERAWRKSPVRAQLQSDLIQCRRLVREFKSDAGWGICNDSGSTRTLYRRELRHDTHSFKVTGIAECALMDLFAVIYEADLYAEWFPFMKSTTELATLSRFHKLVHAIVMCPWPLSNRDMVLEAFGVDNTEVGRVLINIRSIEANSRLRYTPVSPLAAAEAAAASAAAASPEASASPAAAAAGSAASADAAAAAPTRASTAPPSAVQDFDLASVFPPEQSSPVRADFVMGGYMLELLGPTTTRVSFFCNVDPKISVVPTSLMNFMTSKLIHVVIGKMEQAAKDTRKPNSKWQERFVRNAAVYDEVRAIAESCMAQANSPTPHMHLQSATAAAAEGKETAAGDGSDDEDEEAEDGADE